MTIKLSPSTLNLMEDCPKCFWLKINKGISRPMGPMSSIPIKMDSIIKSYFDTFRDKDIMPIILDNKINAKLAKDMPKTLSHVDEETQLTIWGRPDDYLELPEGCVIVLDHKTKSKPAESTHPAYQLQLDVYSYILDKQGYQTTNVAYLIYYYPEKSVLHDGMIIKTAVVKVTTSISRVKHLLQKAKEIMEGEMPASGEGCGYCKWLKELQ